MIKDWKEHEVVRLRVFEGEFLGAGRVEICEGMSV